mmetsp:Transcript_69923/g.167840  ORF Transcript_69923/g.167840 Transcript_69923/m.167840 type:complete len:806 (+) Transcript_69923:48-2465(+)
MASTADEASAPAAAAGDAKEVDLVEEVSKQAEETEKECDAAADSRPKVSAGSVSFPSLDTTINVLPWDGTFLKSLSHGGFQYLYAGARANTGLKSGRYMFELRVIEYLTSVDGQGQLRPPTPKQLVRAGFSTSGSSLLQDVASDCVYFDSEGWGLFGDKRKKVGAKFGSSVVAVVLNLDPKLENANTISLFLDGVRAAPPQALPENLRGKALFPTITFKNVTAEVNFGPSAITALPFNCRMVQDAATADVEMSPVKPPKDGKFEVVIPVGLPDTGMYDWASDFIAKNPGYVEISERHILDWATKSSIWVPKGTANRSGSNDKPEVTFGLPSLDDGSVLKTLLTVASATKRSYLLLGVKSGLATEDRKTMLAKFNRPHFRRVAKVMMGEPAKEYKEVVQALLLADKKAKAEQERKKKQAEEDQKRRQEMRKRSMEISKREKEGKPTDDCERPEDVMEVTVPEEEVTLTEEEKQLWCRKSASVDVGASVLNKAFTTFSLPSADEGFDAVQYSWQPAAACEAKLKEWMTTRKRTTRVDDIVPGSDFKEKLQALQDALKVWKVVQKDWKDPVKKKNLLQSKKAALLKQKQEAAKEAGEEPPTEAPELPVIDIAELDVKAVDDVTDIGNGESLFANFEYEDWVLLELRYALHLLVLSYAADLNDPERPQFHESHASFYYSKYFKKALDLKSFKFDKFSQLTEVLQDTLELQEGGMLATKHAADAPLTLFAKLAEEHRRERQRRVDAGDETAMLRFTRVAMQPAQAPGMRWGPVAGRAPQQPSSAPPQIMPQKRPSSAPTPFPAKRSFMQR